MNKPPFVYPTEEAVLSQTAHRAILQAARLTKWSDRPMWFDGGSGQPQILLTEDAEHAYAWVGKNKVGQLVAFDTDHFVGYGLDEPGTPSALAMAIGWYIDVSISLRATPTGTPNLQPHSAGSHGAVNRYVPTTTFKAHTQHVAQGTHSPPAPTMVAGHIMHLTKRHPSEEARGRAPARLRRIMGIQDTYVRPHRRGGAAVADLDKHLSSHSALSDVIGQFNHIDSLN